MSALTTNNSKAANTAVDNGLAQQLSRPELLAMTPYQSARRIGGNGDTWLNANESPFTDTAQAYNRYPEFQPEGLISNYATYSQLDTSQLLATRGADEAIELLIRTFCVSGQDQITICTPTYGMYAISAATCNVAVNEVPLTPDWKLDPQLTDKLDGSKLLFICNPNNPTGSTLTPQQLEPVVARLQDSTLVVVDEAYIEFSSELTMSTLLSRYPNLVILRTLSKAFGLAGIRCGFLLANPPVIELVKKVIAPYPMPAPVAEIATEALTTFGIEKMTSRVAQLNKLNQVFCQHMQTQPGVQAVYASGANFALVRFKDNRCFAALGQQGIVVRDQGKQPTLGCCLRFSIGNAIEMARLQEALTEICKELY